MTEGNPYDWPLEGWGLELVLQSERLRLMLADAFDAGYEARWDDNRTQHITPNPYRSEP